MMYLEHINEKVGDTQNLYVSSIFFQRSLIASVLRPSTSGELSVNFAAILSLMMPALSPSKGIRRLEVMGAMLDGLDVLVRIDQFHRIRFSPVLATFSTRCCILFSSHWPVLELGRRVY